MKILILGSVIKSQNQVLGISLLERSTSVKERICLSSRQKASSSTIDLVILYSTYKQEQIIIVQNYISLLFTLIVAISLLTKSNQYRPVYFFSYIHQTRTQEPSSKLQTDCIQGLLYQYSISLTFLVVYSLVTS